VLLFLNPETTKATSKKLSIETKISVTQPNLVPQSTKNAVKPTLNTISTYRLMQYQKQANTLRNANPTNGAKRIAAKGKKNNRTAVNQSGSKRQITENSIRDTSIENSRHEIQAPKTASGKNRQMSHKTLQESPSKGWCLLDSSLSSGQPISVNINISNHVVSSDARSKAISTKKTQNMIPVQMQKKAHGLNSSHSLGITQPVKGISTNIIPSKKQETVPKKAAPPQKSIPTSNKLPQKKEVEKSPSKPKIIQKPDIKAEKSADKNKKKLAGTIPVTKTLPKPSVQLTQIQNLLKAVITPKAQTQRFSLAPDANRSKKSDSIKNMINTTTITLNTKKVDQNQTSQLELKPSQNQSHSILMSTVSSLHHDSKPKPVPSPRIMPKELQQEKPAENNEKTQEKPQERLFEKTGKVPKSVESPKKLPLTSAQTIKQFSDVLTEYEKGEILDFDTIYFIGNNTNARKVQMGKKGKDATFDDDKGDYNAYVGDHVGYRYEIIDMLGKGSFGQAIKCKDHKTGEMVALKIIRSKKRFYHQATVEVKILKYIKEHDLKGNSNCVKMLDYFTFRKHICIAFELLSINLYDFIKDNNFRGLSLSLIRKFAVQILQALLVLREHSIIHCDLKPENILLKNPKKSGIKLIDFGSSCFAHEKIYTYIQSRFYRAPEIMLAIPYTTAIDMWSFGCILAELYTGFPIFPGESEPEQMALIMEIMGLPPKSMVDRATRREVFFDSNGKPLSGANSREGNRVPGSKNVAGVLKCSDADFIDFLQKCFTWEPEKRIIPSDALAHPWIVKGFPQLAGGQKQNSSITIDPQHYATETVKPETLSKHLTKSKPVLNQSLITNKASIASASNLIITPKASCSKDISQNAEQNGKLENRLIQLRAKLKMMTAKTDANNNANAKTKNDKQKTVVLFDVQEEGAQEITGKKAVKQSNIF